MKVEQAAGLPFLEITVDKAEIARRGLSLAAVQDVIGTAIGGREAGVVFEGDRRFDIVVRLARDGAHRSRGAEEPAGSAAAERRRTLAGSIPLSQVARFQLDRRAATRSAARTASAASS